VLISEYKADLSHAYIDTLLPQPAKDRVRSPADRAVLALHNDTELGFISNVAKQPRTVGPHRTRIAVVDGKRVARKQGDEDAAFPWFPLLACPDHPVNDRVANLVLHFHTVHDRPGIPPV